MISSRKWDGTRNCQVPIFFDKIGHSMSKYIWNAFFSVEHLIIEPFVSSFLQFMGQCMQSKLFQLETLFVIQLMLLLLLLLDEDKMKIANCVSRVLWWAGIESIRQYLHVLLCVIEIIAIENVFLRSENRHDGQVHIFLLHYTRIHCAMHTYQSSKWISCRIQHFLMQTETFDENQHSHTYACTLHMLTHERFTITDQIKQASQKKT